MVYDPLQLRKSRTLEMIHWGFLELLSFKAYESINIVEICTKAMIHRTTFYHHFENKAHLLEYSVARIKSELEQNIPQNIYTAKPQGYYSELMKQLIRYLDQRPTLNKALVEDINNQIFWTKFQDLIAYDVKQRMMTFASNGYHYHVSLQLNAEFYTSGILGALLWWLRHQKPISEKVFFEQLTILMDPRKELQPV